MDKKNMLMFLMNGWISLSANKNDFQQVSYSQSEINTRHQKEINFLVIQYKIAFGKNDLFFIQK
jgi:hypothetical protein